MLAGDTIWPAVEFDPKSGEPSVDALRQKAKKQKIYAFAEHAFPRKEFYGYLQRLIDAGFENRIMFGSDEMVWPEALSAAIDSIENAPSLNSEQKRDILYNNAARFLRLKQ